MHVLFCFSASLFILILMDFSQMLLLQLKCLFSFKTTVAHLHSLKSPEKCLSESSDLFDTALPVITCVRCFEPVIKNQTAYQA